MSLMLAHRGQVMATIVICDGASKMLKRAADDLARCLGVMVGSESAEIAGSGSGTQGVTIHVGPTKMAVEAGIDVGRLEANACRLLTQGETLFIAGGADLGVQHGIYSLLSDHLGVMWGSADPVFEDIPLVDEVEIGELDETTTPSFGFRVFSGGVVEWNQRNRIDTTTAGLKYYGHGHALFRILPPSKYADHPEYYAFVEGKRHVPEADGHTHENPCFTNSDVIRLTIEAARKSFDENLDQTTFSLCPNDSDFFCECDECQKLDEGRKQFRGRKMYSDSYFHYVEAVAAEIAKSHPDRYLGTYAYWVTELPPRQVEKLSDNIVVYLTQDSSQYFDPDYERRDHDMLRTWNKVAANLCVYDYYGLSWVTPRTYPSIAGRTIPFLPTVGVHGFYNEVYPYWAHTGPQLYLVTQMVWDVSRDPLDVMERYYSRMFREVAGQMRRFYEILETVWTTSTKPGRWFEGLNDPHTQAWRWTPTQREEAWQAIHQAHEAVIDDVTRKRIQYVLDGFHHAYLYMKAFHRAVALREVKHPDSLREQIVRLAGLVDAREQVYLNVLQDDETYPTVYYRDTPESDGSPSRFAKLIAKWRQSIGMRIEEALDGHDELRKTLVAENATVQSLISDAEDDLRW